MGRFLIFRERGVVSRITVSAFGVFAVGLVLSLILSSVGSAYAQRRDPIGTKYPVTLKKGGPGKGTIKVMDAWPAKEGTPPRAECGVDCQTKELGDGGVYQGYDLAFLAYPDSNSVFNGWDGCSGETSISNGAPLCLIKKLNSAVSITANFSMNGSGGGAGSFKPGTWHSICTNWSCGPSKVHEYCHDKKFPKECPAIGASCNADGFNSDGAFGDTLCGSCCNDPRLSSQTVCSETLRCVPNDDGGGGGGRCTPEGYVTTGPESQVKSGALGIRGAFKAYLGIDVNGKSVSNVASPSSDSDAATKEYVDQAVARASGGGGGSSSGGGITGGCTIELKPRGGTWQYGNWGRGCKPPSTDPYNRNDTCSQAAEPGYQCGPSNTACHGGDSAHPGWCDLWTTSCVCVKSGTSQSGVVSGGCTISKNMVANGSAGWGEGCSGSNGRPGDAYSCSAITSAGYECGVSGLACSPIDDTHGACYASETSCLCIKK